jgi:hypothetical protein
MKKTIKDLAKQYQDDLSDLELSIDLLEGGMASLRDELTKAKRLHRRLTASSSAYLKALQRQPSKSQPSHRLDEPLPKAYLERRSRQAKTK